MLLLITKLSQIPKAEMKTKLIIMLIYFFIGFACSPTFALPSDSQQPLTINSDWAEVNNQKGIGIYRGNVIANQGTSRLTAHEVIIYFDKQHKITKIIASDNPVHFQTLEKPSAPMLYAEASIMKYIVAKHKIILLKNAKVTQGQNVLNGPYINYDLLTETITTHSNSQNRTVVMIKPEQLTKATGKTNDGS